MPAARPVCLYAVAVEAVFATRFLQLAPAFADTSIRYPVTALVPALAGTVHVRSIAVAPADLAARLRGAPGAPVGAAVVALATFDGGPAPEPLIARTR